MNVTGPTTVSHVLPAGSKLHGGDFSVGKKLGQGGFGITYLGSDTRLRRSVAIKEFFVSGPEEYCIRQSSTVQPSGRLTVANYLTMKQKFLDEASVLAQFHHPGIVQVHISFEENNSAYMVMEFLKGKTLLEVVEERGALPEREAVYYIQKVSEALDVVHQKHLLHRDLKPANVLLTENGGVVLIDFGSAREFAAGKTKRMTAMLTEGYAPLEQYGQQARFGTFTDIYALGAMLYHLLTGRVPVQATDRASDVSLPAPRRANSSVSQVVSDAVMWAMEMKVDKRPQTVEDFLGCLRGSVPRPAAGPRNRSKDAGSVRLPVRGKNPYEPRIEQLLKELNTPAPVPPPFPMERQILDLQIQVALPEPSPPPFPDDVRIKEIEHELAKPAPSPPPSQYEEAINQINAKLHFLPPAPDWVTKCPACHVAKLDNITGEATGECPLCRTGRVVLRTLDVTKCGACCKGKLVDVQVGDDVVFCPVCRAVPVSEERRKRLGVAVDLWWVCPQCKAEFDVFTGGKARLEIVQEDWYGLGTQYRGKTLPIGEWKRLSNRSNRYHLCDSCDAQFDQVDYSRITLVNAGTDPSQSCKQHLGKTFYRLAWAKIAQGLPLTAGNLFCPYCRAEFEYDQAGKTLKLLQGDLQSFPWAQKYLGQPTPVQTWYLAGGGKTTVRPGWLCPSCNAEFDTEPSGMRLVKAAQSVLSPCVGRVYSLEDWHRLAAGFPTSEEEQRMRGELFRFRELTEQEERPFILQQEESRRSLSNELENLRIRKRLHRQNFNDEQSAEVRKVQDALQSLLDRKQRHAFQYHHDQQKKREKVESQINDLLKRSFIELYVPIAPTNLRLTMPDGEAIIWESPACKLSLRTSQGAQYWRADDKGTLAVTNQRILLDAPPALLWQRPLEKVLDVTAVYAQLDGLVFQKRLVVSIRIDGLQKPVGFAVDETEVTVPIGKKKRKVKVGGAELAQLMNDLVKVAR